MGAPSTSAAKMVIPPQLRQVITNPTQKKGWKIAVKAVGEMGFGDKRGSGIGASPTLFFFFFFC